MAVEPSTPSTWQSGKARAKRSVTSAVPQPRSATPPSTARPEKNSPNSVTNWSCGSLKSASA
jgi:hypothetical protein